jgi:hypothetical protein
MPLVPPHLLRVCVQETTIMKRATIKGAIAIGVAVSIALFGAVATAQAGKGKGGGGGGGFKGGGMRASSHAFKSGGAGYRSGPKFHTRSSALRYGGSSIKAAKHGPRYAYAKKGPGKPNSSHNKKWHGNYKPYQHYSKYPYYRRRGNYAWYGVPLYGYGGGCGWLHRQAVLTGSDYWWDRYYRCSRYSY